MLTKDQSVSHTVEIIRNSLITKVPQIWSSLTTTTIEKFRDELIKVLFGRYVIQELLSLNWRKASIKLLDILSKIMFWHILRAPHFLYFSFRHFVSTANTKPKSAYNRRVCWAAWRRLWHKLREDSGLNIQSQWIFSAQSAWGSSNYSQKGCDAEGNGDCTQYVWLLSRELKLLDVFLRPTLLVCCCSTNSGGRFFWVLK